VSKTAPAPIERRSRGERYLSPRIMGRPLLSSDQLPRGRVEELKAAVPADPKKPRRGAP